MSQRKRLAHGSERFLEEQGRDLNSNIHNLGGTLVRHQARSKHTASRMMPIGSVLGAVVVLTIGSWIWGAKTGSASVTSSPQQVSSTVASAPPLPLLAEDQASGSPASDAVPSSQQEQSAVPAAQETASHRRSSRSSLNEHLSRDLSDYLHQHHLPFVDAMVFSNESGRPTLVKLSGQVRTQIGKEDANTKSTDFLNQPGLRVENHVEVDAGLASTAAAPSSASLVPASTTGPAAGGAVAAAPGAPVDPCTDLCLKDEGHCNTACQTQAAGGAAGGGVSLQGLLGQFGQSASALKQCNDQCVQTREHCTYQCQTASSGMPPEGAGSSDAPPPGGSPHQAEGPDTPPE